MIDPLVPDQSRAADIARLDGRLSAIERSAAMVPRHVGELIPYGGPITDLIGEQEIQPGFLLANGSSVPLERWPELVAIEGLYGTTGPGFVQLPSPNTLGSTSGWLIYAGRRSPSTAPPPIEGTPFSFVIAANTDDGYVGAEFNSAVWRPATANVSNTSTSTILAASNKDGANNYLNDEALVRWDTSSLADGATINGALLRFYVTAKTNGDIRSLIASWYEPGTITTADYTATPGTNAIAGYPIASILTGVVNSVELDNAAANVNKTGFTGLRLAISDPAPMAENSVQIAAFEHAAPACELVVYVA